MTYLVYQCLKLKVVCESINECRLSNTGLAQDENGEAIKGLQIANKSSHDILGISSKCIVFGTVAPERVVCN